MAYMMKSFAAVVCVLLLQSAWCVPVQKQSKSGLSETAPIHKRSAATVEFLMNQESYSSLANENNQQTQLVDESELKYNNDLRCPSKTFTGANDPIYMRSSCPWYYVKSHDPRRFPAVILKAENLCDYAIGSNGMLECTAITQTISVLKKQRETNGDGKYVWLAQTETVVIGYTATGRRLAESQPQTTPATSNRAPPTFAKK